MSNPLVFKRVEAGKYESTCGRYTVARDTDFEEYSEWYLDRHPEINTYANNGCRAIPVWSCWDNELDDYPGRDNRSFKTKKEAVKWLNDFLAKS